MPRSGLLALAACTMLAVAARADRDTVPWTERLHAANPEERKSAALGLYLCSVPAEDAVPLLAALLDDPDPMVRREAAVVLWEYGPRAEAASAPLVAHLSDASAEVRRICAGALGELSRSDERAAALTAALDDPHAGVRREALRSLARFGSAAAPAAERVRLALRLEIKPVLRELAARVLGRIGAPAAPARADLEEAARGDADPAVRVAAAEALERLRADRR